MSMKIAIPVYGDHVSNVFDFAHRLLLVDIGKGKETKRCEIALQNKLLVQRAVQLKSLEVNLLICGAISQELATMVISSVRTSGHWIKSNVSIRKYRRSIIRRLPTVGSTCRKRRNC